MFSLILYKTLFYFSTHNIQAIDFNQDGNLLYTINKKENNKQYYDVFKYINKDHTKNIKILSNINGHGDKYRARDTKIVFNGKRFYFKNRYGAIQFNNWWKEYGKVVINGINHKIDFDILNNKLKTKGTFQGVALNKDYALFTLSFFDKKTKKLLKNKLYVYDLTKRKTFSYDLVDLDLDLDLGKYSVKNKKYKYYEFEGLTYYKGKFYLGVIITVPYKVKNMKKYKKIVLFYSIDTKNIKEL